MGFGGGGWGLPGGSPPTHRVGPGPGRRGPVPQNEYTKLKHSNDLRISPAKGTECEIGAGGELISNYNTEVS